MYYSKDVESFGTGLRRIMTLCQEANVKVEFKPSKIGFTVVFHRLAEVNGNNEPPDAEKKSQKFTDWFTEKFTDKFTENETQQQII